VRIVAPPIKTINNPHPLRDSQRRALRMARDESVRTINCPESGIPMDEYGLARRITA